MPRTPSHAPGTFCWVELATTDDDAAKRFYTSLLGWDAGDVPMGPDGNYTILRRGGVEVAALYAMGPKQAGDPPQWMSHVSVESADASAARVRELGGTVVAGPFDVMDVGRMAILQDPGGALLCLWEPRSHHGAGMAGEPGSLCWNELATRDTPAAERFYAGLFGWRASLMGEGSEVPYTMLALPDGTPAGGMYAMPAEMGDVPPHWMVYFAVEDADAAAARAAELGGTVVNPPADVPGIGRFATLRDPQGAGFSVIRLDPVPEP